MQWLTLVSEDSGVQRLKADNRRPAATPSVDPVSANTAVHTPRSGEQVEHKPVADRRRGERRSGHERRSEQHPVLLDTRCSQDRRSGENRRQSSADCEQRPPARTRINLYA
jgi:hypothetical protein